MTLAPPKTRKKTSAHRKRTGEHQHRSKHFAKTYWPYLPMVLIVLGGFLLSTLWQPDNSVLGQHTDLSPTALLERTNIERSKNQEPGLSINEQLSDAAQAKAEDMVARNYWSHNTPDGKQPWAFVTQAGYTYATAGENLAYGFSSADLVVEGWMNSPEHRANILEDAYRDVGFGVAASRDFQGKGAKTVIVALYALPARTVLGERTPVTQTFDGSARTVAYVQLLTNTPAQISLFVTMLTLVGAVGVVVGRHARLWHRVVARGEHFVLTHPYLDITVVMIGTMAYLLVRAAGTIL